MSQSVESNKPFKRIFTNAMGASFSTTSVGVPDYYTGQIQMVWTGYNGTTGSATIETSSDGVNWNESGCADTSSTITGAADNQIWELMEATGQFYRLVFTEGDGTAGTATTTFCLRRRVNG
jgi:hypothetical protein